MKRKHIREIRKGLGIKATEMAQEIGVSSGYICNIEMGRRTPSKQTKLKIESYLRHKMKENQAMIRVVNFDADRLAELMEENDISTTDLSNILNCHYQTVRTWLRKDHKPTTYFFNQLVEYFKIEENELLIFTEEPSNEASVVSKLENLKEKVRNLEELLTTA